MISVKNILGDDIFGVWHVKKIIVRTDGKRFSFAPDKETFRSKEEAEVHAYNRARLFLQRKLGLLNADIFCARGRSWKGKSVFGKAMKVFQDLRRRP
jgi:hypothetical protein